MADLETVIGVVLVLPLSVAFDSVLVFAADANFLGFGAGGGGRLFMAVGETAEHRPSI